jgi:uncharacterized protein
VLRAVPADLDTGVVAEIDARLDGVERAHGVRVPWAIESGSRAWGFPSPDSDYDCRFVFVRPADAYRSLWPERDVIETPLDAVFDVNGWDLAKAVRLVVRGNATVGEWLRSPIVYRGDAGFRDRMLEFAGEVVERGALARHYRHVGLQQRDGAATLKRFFYALRPAMTLRWLRVNPQSVVPPMTLPQLVVEADVTDETARLITELIAVKAVTREMGSAPPPPELERFVDDELARAEWSETAEPSRDPAESRARADAFFVAETDRAAT